MRVSSPFADRNRLEKYLRRIDYIPKGGLYLTKKGKLVILVDSEITQPLFKVEFDSYIKSDRLHIFDQEGTRYTYQGGRIIPQNGTDDEPILLIGKYNFPVVATRQEEPVLFVRHESGLNSHHQPFLQIYVREATGKGTCDHSLLYTADETKQIFDRWKELTEMNKPSLKELYLEEVDPRSSSSIEHHLPLENNCFYRTRIGSLFLFSNKALGKPYSEWDIDDGKHSYDDRFDFVSKVGRLVGLTEGSILEYDGATGAVRETLEYSSNSPHFTVLFEKDISRRVPPVLGEKLIPTEGTFSTVEGPILFYPDEFDWLHNFSAHAIVIGRDRFDTAEHYYHWLKFSTVPGEVAQSIMNATSPQEAWEIAQRHREERPSDWDDIKLDQMRKVLLDKLAQHPSLKQKLIETGNRELIEKSPTDTFWGKQPDGTGNNWLGRLWMEIRKELQDQLAEQNRITLTKLREDAKKLGYKLVKE